MKAVASAGSQDQDIAVIGAGPAGSTLAIALKGLAPDLRVALIDAQRFPRDKACGDGLGPGVHRVLGDLGLSDLLADYPAVSDIVISGLKRERIAGGLPALGVAASGRVVPRKVFDARLHQAALDRGVASMEGARLVGAAFDPPSERWRVCLAGADGSLALQCRVLVGADGARSNVRRLLGIPFNGPRHTDIAARSYVRTVAAASSRPALELHYTRALLPGYAWVFPAGAGMANLGVGLNALDYKARSRNLRGLLGDFYGQWSAETHNPHAQGPPETRSAILPLGSQLPPLARGAAALVGDAASMVHPLTGEGIAYAMAGAQMLAQCLADGLQRNLPLGESLRRYDAAFRARFQAHFDIAYRLKQTMAVPSLSDMLLRACLRDRHILVDIIDIIMGEGRRFRLGDAARILAKGLWP